MSSSNLPVDVLQMILEYVDKADLLTLCRVNKVCCSCSQDILYRNIYADNYSQLEVCRTLAQSTHLARRVRSFSVVYLHLISITDPPKDLAMAIQNMSSLRSLKLYMHGRYIILDECTFKLDSFITDFPCDEYLRFFLNSQPTLTHVELHHDTIDDDVQAEFEATCLPNLTRVTAELPLLQRLIPGRPLSEVDVVWYPRENIPSIDFFTLSAAPIQKLTMTSCFIYTIPFEFLASIFSSLTHLSICMELGLSLNIVRGPLFSLSNHWILN
jgi:F-box-like